MAQKLAPFDKNGALDMSATSAAFLASTGALLVTMVYYISIYYLSMQLISQDTD